MNRNASTARDPIARCFYFLSLLEGIKVEEWVEHKESWLLEVESDPSVLSPGKSAWDILEQDFQKSFVDYAERERAFDDIQKLKMKEAKVDEYIATFESLGRRAGMDLDDPSALRMFARGLPRKFAEACIHMECPEIFEQWAKAARRQHESAILRNWYLLSNDDGPSQSSAPQRNTSTCCSTKSHDRWGETTISTGGAMLQMFGARIHRPQLPRSIIRRALGANPNRRNAENSTPTNSTKKTR